MTNDQARLALVFQTPSYRSRPERVATAYPLADAGTKRGILRTERTLDSFGLAKAPKDENPADHRNPQAFRAAPPTIGGWPQGLIQPHLLPVGARGFEPPTSWSRMKSLTSQENDGFPEVSSM